MKINIKYILVLLVLLGGCNPPANRIKKMEHPIVIVGISEDGDITLCDSQNTYLTVGHDYYLAKTISSSYQKGDTLIYHNNR